MTVPSLESRGFGSANLIWWRWIQQGRRQCCIADRVVAVVFVPCRTVHCHVEYCGYRWRIEAIVGACRSYRSVYPVVSDFTVTVAGERRLLKVVSGGCLRTTKALPFQVLALQINLLRKAQNNNSQI